MFTFRPRFTKRLVVLMFVMVLVACGGTQVPTATVTQPPLPSPTAALTEPPPPSPTPITANPPSPTPTATPVPPSAEEIRSRVDEHLNKAASDGSFVGAVLLGQDGEILLSKAYGEADREKHIPNTPRTKYPIASMSKQFTAMAIMILQAEGRLDVQDSICAHLPDCPAAWQEVTIHHLLNHTSGLRDFANTPDYLTPSPSSSAATAISPLPNLPLVSTPGKMWNYLDTGYALLGMIIQQVSGETYEDFVRERIFVPLQMMDTGCFDTRDGIAIGYTDQRTTPAALPASLVLHFRCPVGGLYSTVEDLYRWDQALYTDKLIPQDLLEKMFTSDLKIPASSGGGAYGYGWGIGWTLDPKVQRDQTVVNHPGAFDGYSSSIVRYLRDRIVLIILSNQLNGQEGPLAYDMTRTLDRIIFEQE